MVGITGFWKPLDFHFNQAINFVLHKLTKLVDSEGREGQLAYSEGSVYVHNGTEWVEIGSGGAADTLTFDFSSEASDAWVINHGLGKLVTVQTMTTDGVQVFGTVEWDLDSLDSVTVRFSEPVQGTAIIGYANGSMDSHVYGFSDSDTWVVNHGLGKYVVVQTMTNDGVQVFGTASWSEDMNTVTISFSEPISGTAIIL